MNASVWMEVGGVTFENRESAFELVDYSTLLAVAAKRGGNRVAPGTVGRKVRPRTLDELYASPTVKLRGNYTAIGIAGGTLEERKDRVHDHLATLVALVEPDVVRPLTFHWRRGEVAVNCQLETFTVPHFGNPWTAELALSITFPGGRLTSAAAP